jgi:transposase InsO family protein
LSILQRKHNSPIQPNRVEKITLAVLAARLKRITHRSANQLRDIIRIFQPETILRWHRELVRRKWTYPHKTKGGRPSISKELEELILRLAHENPRWGYGKIQGELVKLSFKVSQSTVRNILDRHGIQPVLVRNSSIGWRHLMTHYKEQILACDFFTIDTIWLQTIYVLFFIELGSRRIHFAGVTSNPNQTWITQQARQLIWDLHDRGRCSQFLIHDNDCSFSKAFDAVFESEGISIIHTPFQAPNANAHAERWVRTVREECLDHILIINAEHLQRFSPPSRDRSANVHSPQYTEEHWLYSTSKGTRRNDQRLLSFIGPLPPFHPLILFPYSNPLSWSFLCTEKRPFRITLQIQHCELTFLLINGWKTRIPFPIFFG